MKIQIEVDDSTAKILIQKSGAKSLSAAVRSAIREFIAIKKRTSIMNLRGKIDFEPGYDIIKLRRQKTS